VLNSSQGAFIRSFKSYQDTHDVETAAASSTKLRCTAVAYEESSDSTETLSYDAHVTIVKHEFI